MSEHDELSSKRKRKSEHDELSSKRKKKSTLERSSCCDSCCEKLISLIITFTIFGIVWGIFLPQNPTITITDAHLTQFNFTNSTLYYNLGFNVTIRNPNKRVGISYRRIQVIGNYRKKRFSMLTLPNTTVPFHQGPKNTTILRDTVLQGQQVVKFGKKEISQYNKETAAGVYTIDAVLAFRLKLTFGKARYKNFAPDNTHCKLKLPFSTLNQTSTSNITLITTKCGNVGMISQFFLSWIPGF